MEKVKKIIGIGVAAFLMILVISPVTSAVDLPEEFNYFDTNGDGMIDNIQINWNGEGQNEFVFKDRGYDGSFDDVKLNNDDDTTTDIKWTWWDLDGDGVREYVLVEFNDYEYYIKHIDGSQHRVMKLDDEENDGVTDTVWIDTDGDGHHDALYMDQDGDGFVEVVIIDGEVAEPVKWSDVYASRWPKLITSPPLPAAKPMPPETSPVSEGPYYPYTEWVTSLLTPWYTSFIETWLPILLSYIGIDRLHTSDEVEI